MSWNGPRGACSGARIRSQKGLSANCETREPRSAPAKHHRRRGARKTWNNEDDYMLSLHEDD